jgi:hypothetical protein
MGCLKAVCRLLCLVTLTAVAGCSDGVKTYKIPGRVVYQDGAPVPNASLVLQTGTGEQAVTARGMTGVDGAFTLTTFEDEDGVVEGEHTVSLSPMPAPEGVKQATIPAAYWDFGSSGLKTSVTPTTPEIVITIDRNRKK